MKTIGIPDCENMEKAKEDNEKCKADLDAVLGVKDLEDCDELEEACV